MKFQHPKVNTEELDTIHFYHRTSRGYHRHGVAMMGAIVRNIYIQVVNDAYIMVNDWLVVWNMNFSDFPYIGVNNPN